MAKPVGYSTELKKALKTNNLPDIKVPDDPLSLEIIMKIHQKESKKTNVSKQPGNKEPERLQIE